MRTSLRSGCSRRSGSSQSEQLVSLAGRARASNLFWLFASKSTPTCGVWMSRALCRAAGEYAACVNGPGRGTYPALGPNTVVITAADFEDGRLPSICAVTGPPPTANLTVGYSTTPGWFGCLFFINFFALVVAYLF